MNATLKLLQARKVAIKACVEECEAKRSNGANPTEELVLTMLAQLVKEAVGRGFDSGVRYMVENESCRR